MIVTDALLTLEKVEDEDAGKEEVDQAGGGNTKWWVVCWVEAQETEAKHQGNLMYNIWLKIANKKTLLVVHLLIQLDHSQVVIGLEGCEEEDEEEHHGNHSPTPKYFLAFLSNLQEIRHTWGPNDEQLIKSSHPILFTTVTALATSAKKCWYKQKDEAMSTGQPIITAHLLIGSALDAVSQQRELV